MYETATVVTQPIAHRQADAPFNRPDADVIIRSNDNVDFHAHRLVLSLASTVFADMFTLPQSEPHERPVVLVTEDSTILGVLLRLLYPTARPQLDDLDLTYRVFLAACKYDLTRVLQDLGVNMAGFLKKEPIRVYAIACELGIEDVADAAAREAVNQAIITDNLISGLERISAGAYHRLLKLRDRYERNVQVSSSGIAPFIRSSHSQTTRARSSANTRLASVPFNDPQADLTLRSSDGVEFKVTRARIQFASSSMLSGGAPNSVVDMEESSSVLDILLRLIYPTSRSAIDDIDVFLNTIRAAEKYQILVAQDHIRTVWSTWAQREPLRLYFMAVEYGWNAESLLCAQYLVARAITTPNLHTCYTEDMESMLSGPYFRLLHYASKCQAIVKTGVPVQTARSPCTFHQSAFPRTCYPSKPPSWVACIELSRDRFLGHDLDGSWSIFNAALLHELAQGNVPKTMKTIDGKDHLCNNGGAWGQRCPDRIKEDWLAEYRSARTRAMQDAEA